MRKSEVAPSRPLIIEDEQYVPSRGWVGMIRKVYEVNMLLCPECGAEMKIIAFIENHKVIDMIIRYLRVLGGSITLQPSQPLPRILNLSRTRVSVFPEGSSTFLNLLENRAHLSLIEHPRCLVPRKPNCIAQ